MRQRLWILKLLFLITLVNFMLLCYFCANIDDEFDVDEDNDNDVHLPYESFRGALDDFNDNSRKRADYKFTVAVGSAITSRGVAGSQLEPATISRGLVFFKSLLPSFCNTASEGYKYSFYLGHDFDDPFFSRPAKLSTFLATFRNITNTLCHNIPLELHFVKCNYTHKPAWSQNDAMMEAYQNGAEYFYRVNDDTIMDSSNWTEHFIDTLASFHPPNIGVVGPAHSGGLRTILTYDFVHRSHIRIFGFYYPREFPDWYGDTWISEIYKPGRVAKLRQVKLTHTTELKTRYEVKSQERLLRLVTYRSTKHLRKYLTGMMERGEFEAFT